jgi:putative methyltransferase
MIPAKRRIYFSSITIGQSAPILPYPWGILRAFAEADARVAAGYRFEEPFFIFDRKIEYLAKMEDPFLLAASCYAWNLPFQMKICEFVKTLFEDCIILVGGPEIPLVSEAFFRRYPFVDIAVHGEGEIPFHDVLLELLEPSPMLRRVGGLTLREGDTIHNTGPARASLPVEIDTETLPSPFLLGYFEPQLRRCKAMGNPAWALLETNRGCPHRCTFCSWGVASTCIKRFDMDRLRQEIEYLADHEVPTIYIADANFGILPRDVAIAEAIVQNKHRTGYPIDILVNFAKRSNKEVLAIGRMFKEAELLRRGVILAFQSMSEEVLRVAGRSNMKPTSFRALKTKYDSAGIATSTDIILGLPLETRESWRRGLCELFELGQHDNIRVFTLTILPNTELDLPATRERYGLKTVCKAMHARVKPEESGVLQVIRETRTMSSEDLIDCWAFSTLIVDVMHGGGYSRFLSIYLRRECHLSYLDFYDGLYEWAASTPHSLIGEITWKLKKVQREFLNRPEIPMTGKLLFHEELLADLAPYAGPDDHYLLNSSSWAWLRINEEIPRVLGELRSYLESRGVHIAEVLEDLLCFQADIILTPQLDLLGGKQATYRWNWPSYFFGDGVLRQEAIRVHFRDRENASHFLGLPPRPGERGEAGTGPSVQGDLRAFARMACGHVHFEGKGSGYYHQRDQISVKRIDPSAPSSG